MAYPFSFYIQKRKLFGKDVPGPVSKDQHPDKRLSERDPTSEEIIAIRAEMGRRGTI